MGSSENNFGRMGAAAVGVVYLAVGVIGFAVTGLGSFVSDTNDTLLGFDINPFHNCVHIVVGIWFLMVARLNRTAAEGALIGGGLFYLVAAILGFDNRLQIISINDAMASDNFLHLVSGSAALLIGLASVSLNRSKGPRNTVKQF